jgi:hypothetical protein
MAPILSILVSMIALTRAVHASPAAVPLSDAELAVLAAGEDSSADGLYIVEEHPETKERRHFKVRGLSEGEALTGYPEPSGSLKARAYDGFPNDAYVSCPDSYLWSDDLYQKAYNGLWGLCNNNGAGSWYIRSLARGTYNYAYFRYGQAVAYFCNFGVGGGAEKNRCTNSEWGNAVGVLQRSCTKSGNGWAQAGK